MAPMSLCLNPKQSKGWERPQPRTDYAPGHFWCDKEGIPQVQMGCSKQGRVPTFDLEDDAKFKGFSHSTCSVIALPEK